VLGWPRKGRPATPHHAPPGSADTEGLTHLAVAEAGLLVLRERLAELLEALPATPLLLALLALLTLLTLLALLEQRHDHRRQRLLHGLLHRLPYALAQRGVQCDGQVRVRLVGDALLLELLLDLLDLLQHVLHALCDLLARLLTRLLDGLLDDLLDLTLRGAALLAELLHGRGTGHHRHGCSVRCHGEANKQKCVGLSEEVRRLEAKLAVPRPQSDQQFLGRNPLTGSGDW
jgi:hypothetical protein